MYPSQETYQTTVVRSFGSIIILPAIVLVLCIFAALAGFPYLALVVLFLVCAGSLYKVHRSTESSATAAEQIQRSHIALYLSMSEALNDNLQVLQDTQLTQSEAIEALTASAITIKQQIVAADTLSSETGNTIATACDTLIRALQFEDLNRQRLNYVIAVLSYFTESLSDAAALSPEEIRHKINDLKAALQKRDETDHNPVASGGLSTSEPEFF